MNEKVRVDLNSRSENKKRRSCFSALKIRVV